MSPSWKRACCWIELMMTTQGSSEGCVDRSNPLVSMHVVVSDCYATERTDGSSVSIE